jgi:TonB family protein
LSGWISTGWRFLIISLALHGIIGWTVFTVPWPESSSVPKIITVQIVEEKKLPEERKLRRPLRGKTEKFVSPKKVEEREEIPVTELPPKIEPLAANLVPKDPETIEVQTVSSMSKGPENGQASNQEVKREEGNQGGEKGEGTIATGVGWGNTVLVEEGKSKWGEQPPAPAVAWVGPSKDSGGRGLGGAKGAGGGERKEADFLKTGKPGSAGSPEGKGRANLIFYLRGTRLKIEQAKQYPREAQEKRWEGKVILSFQIDRQGEVRDLRVIQSSGHRILDEEGMATLRRASPLPSPLLIEKESLVVEVPILFRLEEGR